MFVTPFKCGETHWCEQTEYMSSSTSQSLHTLFQVFILSSPYGLWHVFVCTVSLSTVLKNDLLAWSFNIYLISFFYKKNISIVQCQAKKYHSLFYVLIHFQAIYIHFHCCRIQIYNTGCHKATIFIFGNELSIIFTFSNC